MSINFTASTITYIANGQAINAAVLNAPSVDLFDRTEEILRYSREQQFSDVHFTENSVSVVPLPTTNSSAPVLTITATATADAASPVSTTWKSYKFSLTNCVIEVKPKLVPGANYIINSTAISTYFNDTQTDFKRKELILPGDTLCLKVPKTTDGFDGEVEGITDQRLLDIGDFETYLSSTLPSSVSLVKLPVFREVRLSGLALGPTDILGLCSTSFPGFSASILPGGSLSYGLSPTRKLFFKLDGGIYYLVNSLAQEGDTVVVGLSQSTSLTFPRVDTEVNHSAEESIKLFGFYVLTSGGELVSGVTNGAYRVFNNTIAGGNQVQISVAHSLLDTEYEYIPIARLGDYSLHVAGRTIPLLRGVSLSGSSAIGWNSVGAPRELNSPADGTVSSVGILVSNIPYPSMVRTVVSERVTLDFSYDPTLKALATIPIFDHPALASLFSAGGLLVGASYRVSAVNATVSRVFVGSLNTPQAIKVSFIVGNDTIPVTLPVDLLESSEDVLEINFSKSNPTIISGFGNHYGTSSTKITSKFVIKPTSLLGVDSDLNSYAGPTPQITVDISLIPL